MVSWWLVGSLLIVVSLLLLKIWLLQQGMAEMSVALAKQLASDSNALLRTSSRDKKVRQLTAELNQQLGLLRHERHHYLTGNRELSDSVTNISHDLRTPLTAICGYLDLLETEETSATTERYLKVIANRVEALKKLTDELFRYSVVMDSTENQVSETVVVNEVLAESLAAYYAAFKRQEIIPKISIAETKVIRQLNRDNLSRVFTNLLENVLSYSDGDVAISLTEAGEIIFTNQALALNEIEVGKLFDRFYTVETGRKSTGLGLAIVKYLVDEMDGELSAEYFEGEFIVKILL